MINGINGHRLLHHRKANASKIFSNFFNKTHVTKITNSIKSFSDRDRPLTQRQTTNFCYISENLKSSKNLIEEFEKIKSELLYVSPIRILNIGYNYFRHVNPRRKKILMTLLNSYIKQFSEVEQHLEIKKALDLFYNKEINSSTIKKFDEKELDLSEELLWHLNMIVLMERIASQYSRWEFLEYDKIINLLNSTPKEKRNRSKFVFTSHPTQPNSIDQLKCISEIFKGLEENDLDYLDYWMNELHQANKKRVFKKPSYLEESVAYHKISIPNLINACSMLYELGLKEPGDFFEIPGTWLTFDFDNHPEMSVGLMTYTHGHLLTIVCELYLKMIKEAQIEKDLHNVEVLLEKVKTYGNKLMQVSDEYRSKKISKKEFYERVPVINVYGIESTITSHLNNIIKENCLESKTVEISKKLLTLFQIFRLTGCLGQIRFAGEDLYDENNIKEIITDILKEISILNANGKAAEMIIIANYEYQKQYELVKKLMKQYQIQNVEVVPLLETFSASNDTDSKITMIASSDTRQRDGLLLTELRTLREYKKNPDKYIYMGQGIPAERGGGPYNLVHQKLHALTKVQRERHIRTVQGHLFTSEFISRDLIVTFLLNCGKYLNEGASFEPSQDYMDFLFELDNVVGVPQREMQKTKEFNDFYVKNNIIKTIAETFNYAGSRELGKPLENVKKQRAIVQAYINSDRCSLTHPELAFWDRLDEGLIRKMSKYYYDNNVHFRYVLYMYGFMIKRFDLDFAREELGYSEKNEIFNLYSKGKKALEELLSHLGLSSSSDPMIEVWNQHLGLLSHSSKHEMNQKFDSFRILYLLQNQYVRRYLKEKTIGVDPSVSEKKLRILQSALANISPFNGKG